MGHWAITRLGYARRLRMDPLDQNRGSMTG